MRTFIPRKDSTKNIYECPHCRKYTMIVNDKAGQLVCTICGVCAKTPLYDETSEYRNFAVEHGVKDKSRSSYSGDANASDLGTGIELKGTKRSKEFNEIQRRMTQDPKLVNLKKAMKRIQQLGDDLKLSKSIITGAQSIYKEALDAGLIKNQKKMAIDAVCIYYSCIKNEQSRTLDDVLEQCQGITKKDFDNTYKSLSDLQTLKITVSAAELAKFDSKKLGFPPYIYDAALSLGRAVESWHLFDGQTPETVAGGLILYINSILRPDMQKSNEDIATLVGKTLTTISKIYKDLNGLKEQINRIPEVAEVIEKAGK